MNSFFARNEGYFLCSLILCEVSLASGIGNRREKKQPQREKVSRVSRPRREGLVAECAVTLINGVRAAPISVR
jgi:hypothetical protein